MAAEQQVKVVGGSRFAAAFGAMRQYVKEQGGGRGVVTMDLMPGAQGVAADEERIRKTMELFPQRAGMLRENSGKSRDLDPERARLTIFYGGRMAVFDDFPADKAKELMQLAGSFTAPAASDDATQGQPFSADMPIARKASLQRFLQKRKSRLAAADPYKLPLLAAPPVRAAKETRKRAAEDGGAPWLGFNFNPVAVTHLN